MTHPDNTDKITAWAISPEGQKVMQETTKSIADMRGRAAMATMIPYEKLHTPMTDFTYHQVLTQNRAFYKVPHTPIVRSNG